VSGGRNGMILKVCGYDLFACSGFSSAKRLKWGSRNCLFLQTSSPFRQKARLKAEWARLDILYVKNLLGHRKIENTEIYINLERVIFEEGAEQEYHVKVASSPEEIKALLEVGYEYVCEKDGLLYFRKRK